MTSGKCPHPWNKGKQGTFLKGHDQINNGKGCFKEGHQSTNKELNRKLGKERYLKGTHPFLIRNLIASQLANKDKWYGLGKTEWKKLSKKILERDNHTCQSCHCDLKKRKYNCHHIIPYTISKDNSEQNLTSFCIPCHASIEYYTSLQYGGNHEEKDLNGAQS